jgi:hypothetical protein
VEEVMRRIDANVEPERHFRGWEQPEKPYQGEVIESCFRITHIIRYGNSFLPVIEGAVKPDTGGSMIHITMHPRTFTSVFLGIWMGLVGLFTLCAFAGFILTTFQVIPGKFDAPPAVLLIPLGMLAYGYLLSHIAFGVEVDKSKDFFSELLQADLVEET